MQPLINLLKQFARPASVTFLVAALAAGIAISFVPRIRRAGRWYFAALLAFYWIASAPACVERLIVWQSDRYHPLATAADARGARVVVVLSAGNDTIQASGLSLNQVSWTGALRLLEAARLYTLLDHPTVVVSGGITRHREGDRSEGDAMRTVILELGVPADHVLVEAESQTTRDQAREVARMLADRPRQPIVLVTSPTHMSRALAVFKAAGLDPIPSASAFKSAYSLESSRWAPSDVGLLLFDTFVYAVLSDWYYRLRGWM